MRRAQKVGQPHDKDDQAEYAVVHVRDATIRTEHPACEPGRYLVDDEGHIKYRTDAPIDQESKKMDNGDKSAAGFTAPQPQLFANIIEGILGGTLEWGLVIIGVLIAVTLELAGRVRRCPFAVGMYIPLGSDDADLHRRHAALGR